MTDYNHLPQIHELKVVQNNQIESHGFGYFPTRRDKLS
jgi:hypothetical protein